VLRTAPKWGRFSVPRLIVCKSLEFTASAASISFNSEAFVDNFYTFLAGETETFIKFNALISLQTYAYHKRGADRSIEACLTDKRGVENLYM
jgi:hypothetical protein